MEKFKTKQTTVLVIIIVIIGLFYWFEIKPSQIRKTCANNSLDTRWQNDDFKNIKGGKFDRYETCLKFYGLKK